MEGNLDARSVKWPVQGQVSAVIIGHLIGLQDKVRAIDGNVCRYEYPQSIAVVEANLYTSEVDSLWQGKG